MIKINGVTVIQGNFPDGTLSIRAPEDKNQDIYRFDWKYENDAELFTLICLRKHYGNKKAVLYMPYCPHARMDRVKNDADVFTLKYFAEVINSLDFDQVIIRDPHSNVTPALINNCVIEEPAAAINRAVKASAADAICYPDEGAMKRYSAMSLLPYAFCIKKREWETGKILGLDLQNPEAIVGKNVLIVDDICSRGGTFYYTAKALKEAGAKSISLYVTHLEETVFDGDLYAAMKNGELIDHIFTTDSIWDYENPHITVISNL
jgi:ribose-phosphate pyrophosphokinase